MEDDKIKDGIKKYNDWWAKYNFGTRISLMTSLILLVIVVIYPLLAPATEIVVKGVPHLVTKEIAHYDKIILAVSDNMLWQFMVVTLGANTIVKVAEVYTKYKASK